MMCCKVLLLRLFVELYNIKVNILFIYIYLEKYNVDVTIMVILWNIAKSNAGGRGLARFVGTMNCHEFQCGSESGGYGLYYLV